MPSDADKHRRAPPREDRAAPTFYVRAMGWLYVACIAMGAVSIVAMTGLIFTGVIMRYFFQMGAQFAEPMAIFFAVQLTMYGAAACYRAHAHLRLGYFVGLLPDHLHRAADWLVHALMAAVAVAMIWYGLSLTMTTWFQAYPEFDYVRVGVVYSGIPGSGLVLLLFVIEAVLWPSPHANPERKEIDAALAQAETVQNRLRR